MMWKGVHLLDDYHGTLGELIRVLETLASDIPNATPVRLAQNGDSVGVEIKVPR